MKKIKGIKIDSPPYNEEQLAEDTKKVDFVMILHSSKKKDIKEFIDNIDTERERIEYVHRYPKYKDTFIGLVELEKKNYYI